MKGRVCLSDQEGCHENCPLLLLRAEILELSEQHSCAQTPLPHRVKHRQAQGMKSI